MNILDCGKQIYRDSYIHFSFEDGKWLTVHYPIGNKVRRLYIMPNKWGGYETILKNDKNECVYDESIGYPYPEMGFFDTIEELEGEILRLYNK